MKTCAPNYYSQFSCRAGACRHSCCIGWEIGIDSHSLALYKNTEGAFGERLRENITEDADGACFCLGENERCPFLNADNLCDIYINLGEDKLCQICADHPRYRNYISGRCELGLGLACEAACELILSQNEKTEWVTLDDDNEVMTSTEWENELEAKRSAIIAIIQNREKTTDERVCGILAVLDAQDQWFGRTACEWREFFLSLERLDDSWCDMLAKLNDENAACGYTNDVIWENLLVYFVNRHVTGAADEWDLMARLSFALLSCAVIHTISAGGDLHDVAEAARMYSSEIEYSEDNTDALLDELF